MVLIKNLSSKISTWMAFDMSEIVWTSGTLAQNIKKWQSIMNMVMNLQVP
jgi:hypothetical protein